MMELNRFSTSCTKALTVEVSVDDALEAEDVPAAELVAVALGAVAAFKVVNAVCAAEISLLESAVETLDRNWPTGLLESAPAGANFSAWARYVFAAVVFPELMAAISSANVLSNEFPLLLEVLEAEEAEDAASSARRELPLCTLEIRLMNQCPFSSIAQSCVRRMAEFTPS